MKYSSQNLAAVLYRLAQSPQQSLEVDNFLSFCHQQKIDYLLPNILHYYQEISQREQNKQTVNLKINHKISSIILGKIKKIIGATDNSQVNLIEDKNILGGFIAEYQNKIFDASLKRQLDRLEHILINNS
jgi:F0F1-type ATP synthase delta subunit